MEQIRLLGAAKACNHGQNNGPRRGALHPQRTFGQLDQETFFVTFGLTPETKNGPRVMKIDALLYTDNGIFTLIAKESVYDGAVVLNGGMVGRDMGVLVGNGLEINYGR